MAPKKRIKNEFEGKWHITEMETWGEDYFNMEVQAFIEIDSKNNKCKVDPKVKTKNCPKRGEENHLF